MEYRFHQAEGIGERLTAEALVAIATKIDAPLGEGEVRAVVFNPALQPLDEVVALTFNLPAEWPAFGEFFGYEQKPAFRIYDAGGAELPYQRLEQGAAGQAMRLSPSSFPEAIRLRAVRVAVRLAVPALGYTTLTLRSDAEDRFTRHPLTPGLATNGHTIENEFLRVAANSDGSLRLTDKRSGAEYDGLLRFEDCADLGDGWNWGPAANDVVVSSRGSRCEIALESNGPQLATLLVRTHLMLPARFHFDSGRRASDWVDATIESRITLRAGADTVEVETTVDNTAEDHRLRVLFPTGADADAYLADGPFDVLERPIALCANNHLARELEVDGKPQQTWTAVSDGRRGLAVISAGVMESGVIDTPERADPAPFHAADRGHGGRTGRPAARQTHLPAATGAGARGSRPQRVGPAGRAAGGRAARGAGHRARRRDAPAPTRAARGAVAAAAGGGCARGQLPAGRRRARVTRA
jgi:alpha-mannosidase/mannosylglycerate hydrolase